MAQRVLWAETNEPIFINRNVIASFRVEEVRGQAVKESDLKRTVRPSTDIHAALLFKDCQQPKFYGWLKKYAIKIPRRRNAQPQKQSSLRHYTRSSNLLADYCPDDQMSGYRSVSFSSTNDQPEILTIASVQSPGIQVAELSRVAVPPADTSAMSQMDGAVMRLRSHSSMSYRGIRTWPPG